MNDSLGLRLLRPNDLCFADTLRALVGWNQTLQDWQRLLALAPNGCFLAEWQGQPAGTTTTTTYDNVLAWIGMVLVHPQFRRRGIGRALLQQAMASLQQRRVTEIKLDATPQGRPVYERLGFQSEWELARWTGCLSSAPALSPRRPGQIRPWQPADLALLPSLDTAAFGVARTALWNALARDSLAALVREKEPGGLEAVGLLRAGARALYLGPVVARSAEAGLDLVKALLQEGSQGQEVYWDIPQPNRAAVAWAQANGFKIQRPLTRMVLGPNLHPGDPTLQFALAGPEIG